MKFKLVWLLAALLIPTIQAANLVVNGDMKQNTNWKIWGSAPGDAKVRTQILSYPNAGPNGERVLQINDMRDDHNPYAINFIFMDPVKKGQAYQLKFRRLAGIQRGFPEYSAGNR